MLLLMYVYEKHNLGALTVIPSCIRQSYTTTNGKETWENRCWFSYGRVCTIPYVHQYIGTYINITRQKQRMERGATNDC